MANFKSTQMKVGTRFQTTVRHHLDNGVFHSFVVNCEVTKVDKFNISYTVLEVVSEDNRPATGPVRDGMGTGGFSKGMMNAGLITAKKI